jgi:hypothetical protein
VAVLAAGTSVIALGAAADWAASTSPGVGQHGTLYNAIAVAVGLAAVAFYAAVALRNLGSTSVGASAARRCGLAGGLVVGGVMLAANAPLVPSLLGDRGYELVTSLGLVMVLFTCVLMGALAARAAGDRLAGVRAGMWCGMLGGAILAIGLLALTLGATGWFTHDSSTIQIYRDSLSPAHYSSYHTHFKSITGFVLSENVDTALIGGLLWVPALAVVFGSLGGALRRGRSEPAGSPVLAKG